MNRLSDKKLTYAQGLITTYLSSKNFDLPITKIYYSIGEVKIFRRQIGRDEPL